jgi:hypothetical protein
VTRSPFLLAILGFLGCALCGGVAAQDDHGRGQGRGEARGEAHANAPGGGRGGPAGGFERAAPMRLSPAPDRREPGGYGYPAPRYAQQPAYAPPRYAAPPPRRQYENGSGWSQTREAPPGAYPGRSAPLSGVIESLRRRSPGRELDASLDMADGRPVYRVLWLTERGRRMDFLVDAETGAILSGR